MNLKTVNEVPEKSKVLLRMDLDVPMENGVILDSSRLTKTLPTLKVLLDKNCKVLIIGHRGRPKGVDQSLSLKPVYAELVGMLSGIKIVNSVFIEDLLATETIDMAVDSNDIVFLENLRFWQGEEDNNDNFRNYLVSLGEVYVNDAFAVAHREHASIMIHRQLPSYFGHSFVEEAKKINIVLTNPRRPLLVILGGAKEDKLDYLGGLEKIADHILVGGKLPRLSPLPKKHDGGESKIIWAQLKADGLDLSVRDIERFKGLIAISQMIVWAGAMGQYEVAGNQSGTEAIALAVAASSGYKIVAGGDTGASIGKLGLADKIDFICSGGGVMLEFLTKGTLPAWE